MAKKFWQALDFLQSGTTLAEWSNFAIVLFIGILVCTIAYAIVQMMGFRLLKNIHWLPSEQILPPFRVLVVGLIALQFVKRGLDVFKGMPGWLWQWKSDLIPWLYGLVFLIFAMRIIDIVVESLRRAWSDGDSQVDETVAVVLGHGIKALILLIVALFILDNLGVKILGIITGLGFLGAALALASQATIANAIGYFEILFDKLFRLGDLIAFGDKHGFVTKRGFRSVQIQALTGEKINVPNKDLVDKQIRNFTKGKLHWISTKLGIAYKYDRQTIERVMEVLKNALNAFSSIERTQILLKQLGESSLEMEIIFWAPFHSGQEYNKLLTEVNLLIKGLLDQNGIEIAFPTRMIVLDKTVIQHSQNE
jgi:small-conductance mechanosensitive channel